ncbi:MAG: GspE/PulE family protein [Gammaproteobacteria bacterium]|nr:GspE/PulE family protein [Gammaproteobacteria bacterium]
MASTPANQPPSSKPRKKIRIGDLLVQNKIISQLQLDSALSEQKTTGRKLGRILVENGYIDEVQLLQFLSRQLNIPYIDLKHFRFSTETVRLIPEIHARRYRAIALDASGVDVLVGMADPTDIFAFDELSRILQRPIRTAVVCESDLLTTFDTLYRRTEEISNFAEKLGEELRERDIDLGQLMQADDVADAPVVKLLQSLFEDAIQVSSSDVHIEPDENVLRIRQRIDGALHEQIMDDKRIASALVLRLKLMAGLDIAEKRLPQDGRFSLKVKERSIDIRMSTMPIQYGESVVLRLLDQTGGVRRLDELGMPAHLAQRFERLIHNPHGMFLVTGPTGSGKTTSLYAALNLLNRPENKIITVEDPVEYRLSRVNQVQVNPEIGLTFARVLRAVLRQDPDVVLVGEMRDEETAEIGIRAALTGHLVLSTLHTNDAVSTVSRLLDMGAKGYLVASALKGVLAQRLVKRVCSGCGEQYQPDANEAAWLRATLGERAAGMQFRRGTGCTHCNGTGYRGRVGVYELLEIDHDLAMALGQSDHAEFARLARAKEGAEPLTQAALQRAVEGGTTLEEVMRISGGFEASPETVRATMPADPELALREAGFS